MLILEYYQKLMMQPQLSIKQTMPLFSPKYQSQTYEQLSTLKRRMNDNKFDQQTNGLAQKILREDSGNYNAWFCKKMFIINSNAQIEHEYKFVDSCLGRGKSFQVWQQKRFLLEYHKDIQRELQATQNIIKSLDTKNYHAWSYRVYLVNKLSNYETELKFAEQMINMDLLNNSCWSYRFFLVQQICDQQLLDKKEILAAQVHFALQKINITKHNVASWNYLRGFFPSIKLKDIPSKNILRTTLFESFDQFPMIFESCAKWWEEQKKNVKTPNQVLEVMNEKIQIEILSTLVQIHSQKEENRQFAVDICEELAVKDKKRQFYWKWVQKNI